MALSLYPILFLVSLPVADLLMINGHPQQSCPILGVRQICAGFGSRLQTATYPVSGHYTMPSPTDNLPFSSPVNGPSKDNEGPLQLRHPFPAWRAISIRRLINNNFMRTKRSAASGIPVSRVL